MSEARITHKADNDKIYELSEKVMENLKGYTLNQITTAFCRITNIIEKDLVIDCSNLWNQRDESR